MSGKGLEGSQSLRMSDSMADLTTGIPWLATSKCLREHTASICLSTRVALSCHMAGKMVFAPWCACPRGNPDTAGALAETGHTVSRKSWKAARASSWEPNAPSLPHVNQRVPLGAALGEGSTPGVLATAA